MPYYDYYCETCGFEFERSVPIAERLSPTEESPVSECPETEQKCSIKMKFATPFVGDPWHFTGKKPDEGFKDRLREIKKHHRGSTINV